MPDPLKLLVDRPDSRDPSSGEQSPREIEHLLEMLAHQQRVAQAGLVTAGLAHDLRNHLTGLYGTAVLAQRSKKPEDWREALAKIETCCLEMTEVTTTFLDFVKRRDTVTEKSFSVSYALTQVERLMRPLAKLRRVAFSTHTETDCQVAGDLRAMSQAIVNLVSNSIRACAETEGSVRVFGCRSSSDTVQIRVIDTGPGIPAHLRRTLFRPFVTGHSGTGGTGIGLFIVRQAIRSLGGRIRIETSPAGTTFTIDLPTC